MKFRNINKRTVIIVICALVFGIAIGGVSGWLLAKSYYENKRPVIVESLEDEFWNNGKATGEKTTATETKPSKQPESKTEKPQTTAPKTTAEQQTVPYGGHRFILNTSSKKIHTPDCAMVKTIDPENYSETDDFLDAIASGYTQCKQCYPID